MQAIDTRQALTQTFRDTIWGAVGYEPYGLQQDAHDDPAPIKQVAGGIRAGKSKGAAMELCAKLYIPNSLFWIVGPDYEQARAEFHYVHEALEILDFVKGRPSVPSRGSCKLETVWGAQVETKTSDDVRRLASFAPHGIVMAEAAQQPHDVYLKLLERCLENRAWLWMSGTFESSLGWYADFFERYRENAHPHIRIYSWPTWANTRIFPGGRNDPAIQQLEEQMPADLFMERCGAVPVKPHGLVHKAFSPRRHVRNLQWDESLPVELAIDPGYGGAYAVLFCQKVGNRAHVLDEVYERNLIAQEIIPKVRARPLFRYVASGVIDVAGTQHHATYSQVEIWEKYAPEVDLRWQKIGVEDGIEVINLYLKPDSEGNPKILFDEKLKMARTEEGLAQGILGEFLLRKYAPYKEGQSEKIRPIKANDHALNALGYYLYDWNGPVLIRPRLTAPIHRGWWY